WLNIPAIRVLELLGVDEFLSLLGKLGFTQLQRNAFYGPSLALGAVDVSLLEVTNAYRVLANGGKWQESIMDYNVPMSNYVGKDTSKNRKIYSEEAAFIISEILANKENRILTFGLDSVLSLSGVGYSVKTGTSKDMRDNWCVGYSKKYTVGVWVGNMSGDPMWNVSGIMGAAPIFVEVMQALQQREKLEGIGRRTVVAAPTPTGLVKRGDSYYIRGTEPIFTATRSATRSSRWPLFPRIIYPTNGMTVALDPDIPRNRQYIFFEAKDISRDNFWRLNGKMIARADGKKSIKWKIARGKYRLQLVSKSDVKWRDEISFMVK
ncbi:MAG: penicillin-binding protein 1C, partial [Oligoflexia bacterium]|nr:penicillin-binding protein 1C [Oligoflexia bacterium]